MVNRYTGRYLLSADSLLTITVLSRKGWLCTKHKADHRQARGKSPRLLVDDVILIN
jgi:hypothetical protein